LGRAKDRLPVGGIIESGEISADEIPLYLGTCDVLTLPLERTVANEGRWPSKVGEYFASGRPVVATRVGDLRAIFEREAIGVLADDEPESFGRALVSLSEDPARAGQLGARALEYGQRSLRWDLIVEKLEAFYEDVRKRSAPQGAVEA
jgi:glycosyltransferase involved in cell wall biosynthesis